MQHPHHLVSPSPFSRNLPSSNLPSSLLLSIFRSILQPTTFRSHVDCLAHHVLNCRVPVLFVWFFIYWSGIVCSVFIRQPPTPSGLHPLPVKQPSSGAYCEPESNPS
ncbi:hypothetical protein Csa_015922 [Cucumis sativus]|uniref:Uncharacterized protein n=1 Tax=Cucumis sativus TaxID=3659 RepID=A0A0A0K3K8_CUCSA|nr:hypothetical protein Csa_015922 [Cucumis sativus]